MTALIIILGLVVAYCVFVTWCLISVRRSMTLVGKYHKAEVGALKETIVVLQARQQAFFGNIK